MAAIERTAASDLGAIRALLASAGLPTADLELSAPLFIVLREDGRLIGAGALQRLDSVALLRSVVVAEGERHRGLGQRIVAELERLARSLGIRELVLLTQTAAAFFHRLGYQAIARDAAPEGVQRSEEFRSLCPSSATCMIKSLRADSSAFNVLFLCTGNSARSILAEALINYWGRGRFRGFSAGSHPKGAVHPIALELLKRMQLPTDRLRSKSWDEFAGPGAQPLDFVFTVCDNAAGEACPHWPGQPVSAHWGLPDPAAVTGSEAEQWAAFRSVFQALENRIKLFTSLPLASLDRIKLKERLDAIGRMSPEAR